MTKRGLLLRFEGLEKEKTMMNTIKRTVNKLFNHEEKRIDKLTSMTDAERAAFTKAQCDMLGDLTWEEAMKRASELDAKTDQLLEL